MDAIASHLESKNYKIREKHTTYERGEDIAGNEERQ